MDVYPWWTEEQKAFAQRVIAFAEEILPRDEETRWKREFPWDIFERIAKEGITGAGVPKEYEGLGMGATGGLHSAFPPEHYRWFPEWVKEENIF